MPRLAQLLVSLLTAVCAASSAFIVPPKKIAVIGAGIGGCSSAFFLRKKFGPEVVIDVFEAKQVGGRIATITVNGKVYETGASIIHPLNLHMQSFVKDLGLKQRNDVPGEKLGIFNGEQFVFEESSWTVMDAVHLLWRYGLSYLRMQMWVEEILDKFLRIYKYQSHGFAFSTNEDLLLALGGEAFIELTKHSLEEVLGERGVSQRFLQELVGAAIRTNYGQSPNIAAFVGAVCLAGAQPGLWAVEGGNNLVCTGLLYAAKAQLQHARVTSISFKKRPVRKGGEVSLYEVGYESDLGNGHDLYDLVVVATPLHEQLSNITFEGFTPPITTFPGSYHHTVATIVHGYVNTSYFGFKDPTSFSISEILTTEDSDLFFNSLSNLSPVNASADYRRKPLHESAVWKVFSKKPLDRQQLKMLFRTYYSVQEVDWLAYPQYNSLPSSGKLPPIVLHNSLYYLNGLEWAASAMEMASIAGQNVALLAHSRWNGHDERVDQMDLMHRIKTEL
ncbi:prenylcysteine oxidase 1 [Petromyzon marinus]|uniref:Prenylcysteine oxidase 1 n=1 Tax=Petromyzon marinus TaxID=7757 RepID=A0AAJ7WQS9_PETMA|nr:prenylcysteine oxidase 1 [Petromyzon marinus]